MTAPRDTVLITGGSGFVGACLTRALIADGYEVHLVLRPEARPWRLAGLHRQYTPHSADLLDAPALRRAVAACRPHVVYHLATHGAYPHQNERAAILTTNLLGTANLLDALKNQEYRSLIQTGSSSEYGHKDAPMRERDLLEPRTDYGVAKAAATLLWQAEAIRGRPTTTVRIFSAYGPWEEPSRLVPYVMSCCLRGETPKVTAGTQPRDFLHVDDVIALLRMAADHPQVGGRILNAGSGRKQTVREMVETIVAVCGQGRVRPEFGAEANRSGEPQSWVANIEETTSLTGWRPRLDLRAGVERTWSWFVNHSRACAA